MDNRAIGVFDSGIGGIPVLHSLMKAFPEEDFIYLGDNGNVPYGNKSKEFISEATIKNINCLVQNNVKAVVIACNTASLNSDIDGVGDVPVFKLKPQISYSVSSKANGCFYGTEATVFAVKKSGILSRFESIEYVSLSRLAEEVENKLFLREKCVLADHLLTTAKKYDFIYLGCTHYLYLKEQFVALTGAKVVFDGVDLIAQNLFNYMEKYGLHAQNIQTVEFIGKFAEKNAEIFSGYFG